MRGILLSPAFLHGARDGGQNAEFRPASLRGLVRYWFRAIAAGLTSEVDAIHLAEADVFGGITPRPKRGVLIRPDEVPCNTAQSLSLNRRNHSGAIYLAYGRERGASSHHLTPGQGFSVTLLTRPDADPDCGRLLAAGYAMWVASALGGLGGRSRHGFGAFLLQDWQLSGESSSLTEPPLLVNCARERLGPAISEGLDAARAAIRSVLPGELAGGTVDHMPHLTASTPIYAWDGGWRASPEAWRDALSSVGEGIQKYLRGEYSGIVPNRACRFNSQSNQIKEWLWGGPQPGSEIDDLAFGLPRGFFSNSVREQWRQKLLEEGETEKRAKRISAKRARTTFDPIILGEPARRASPLVISLVGFGGSHDPRITAILTPMRGAFLPDTCSIHAKRTEPPQTTQADVPTEDDFKALASELMKCLPVSIIAGGGPS